MPLERHPPRRRLAPASCGRGQRGPPTIVGRAVRTPLRQPPSASPRLPLSPTTFLDLVGQAHFPRASATVKTAFVSPKPSVPLATSTKTVALPAGAFGATTHVLDQVPAPSA